MAYLEIETRDGTRRVALERERLSVGRLSYNDVVLPFAQISRQHAELRRINGQWWITDLQSTNGLQINSHRIQEHALADGDRIVMAPGISLVFVAEGAAEMPSRHHPLSLTPSPPYLPPLPSSSPLPSAPLAGQHSADPWAQSAGISGMPDVPGVSGIPGVPAYSAAPLDPGPPSFGGDGRVGYAGASGMRRGERNGHDQYWSEAAAYENVRVTAGPAGTLLHVCQTCGQLTAPDALYCQSCHNSIAHECAKCYLSLLPIQDRCPRCYTPNRMSVRRAHPGRDV